MAYLIQVTKVIILLWMSSKIQCLTFRSDSPDLTLASSLLNYVQPFIKSFKIGSDTIYRRSEKEDTAVESVIKTKIEELHPFLQDKDDMELQNNLELEGEEETTIIEFTPRVDRFASNKTNGKIETDPFEKKLRNYEKMRSKIKLALRRESISRKTKKAITRTLDSLIATIVESQCPWNEQPTGPPRARFLKKIWNKTRTFHDSMNKLNITKEDADKVEKATNIIMNELVKAKLNISLNLLNSFNKTVSHVLKSSETIPEKYKVKCTLVDMDKERYNKAIRYKPICQNFKICSDELNDFLNYFYKSVNDTTVSTFRNYASMYMTDANVDDSEEINTVVAAIKEAGDKVEDRVRRIFIKKTHKFTLDQKKNVNANVKTIRLFVKDTIDQIKLKVDKNIEKDLSSLRTKMILTIKDDIHINLNVELGNVETDTIARICDSFITCNRKLSKSLRKFDSSETITKGNNIYVKVQLTLDDEFKNAVAEQHEKIFGNKNANGIKQVDVAKNYENKATRTTTQVEKTTEKIYMKTMNT